MYQTAPTGAPVAAFSNAVNLVSKSVISIVLTNRFPAARACFRPCINRGFVIVFYAPNSATNTYNLYASDLPSRGQAEPVARASRARCAADRQPIDRPFAQRHDLQSDDEEPGEPPAAAGAAAGGKDFRFRLAGLKRLNSGTKCRGTSVLR
jgi:hypothetical protein